MDVIEHCRQGSSGAGISNQTNNVCKPDGAVVQPMKLLQPDQPRSRLRLAAILLALAVFKTQLVSEF